MSTAVDTFGTTLTVGTGSPIPIVQPQDISGPSLTTDTDEITNHSSPGGFKEFIPTLSDTGDITFPLVFNPQEASHIGLMTARSAKTLDSYTLTYPDGSKWVWFAYVTGFGMNAPVAGHLSADVTLRPSGEPLFTPVAP